MSSVTVIDAGVVTDSLIVAVILIATAALYEPSDVVEENDDTVGAVVSIIIALAPAILLAPVGTVVDVITLPALSIGALVNAYDDTVRSELV